MKINCETHGETEALVDKNYNAWCPQCRDENFKGYLTSTEGRAKLSQVAHDHIRSQPPRSSVSMRGERVFAPIEQVIEEGSRSNDDMWAGVTAHAALVATTLPIDEALKLTDPAEVVREIYLRKKIRAQMVGAIYPNVIVDEVGRLVARFDEVGGEHLIDALWELQKAIAPDL
jgi:hypothetical protein